ncbi:hypothetical protein L596_004696 [Steinernema carpocapsae]|uniref:Uncharacterized protein n=1 Tax=Steinernema carpocapsae TaxID=34508 RepID=A0A4U8UY80_STECR|nr:hypothetical protein L596_004696 [Steinernema carpocapsae]
MTRSVLRFWLVLSFFALAFLLVTAEKRSIALGRLSLRPGKRADYSSTAQDISDVLQFIRVPSVAPFCSGALVEAVTTNLEAVIRLLDKYSTYLERCNELGYDIPI